MKTNKSDQGLKDFLTNLMGVLEKDKKALANVPEVASEDLGLKLVATFGLQCFGAAIKHDKDGRDWKKAALLFRHASNQLETLEVFKDFKKLGDAESHPALENNTKIEVLHYQKFAKTKAAHIARCLREGKTPISGSLSDEDYTGSAETRPQPQEQPRPNVRSHRIFMIKPRISTTHTRYHQ